jgi:hypothetical protein
MSIGKGKQTLNLVNTELSNYEVLDWRWRISAENRIHVFLQIKFDEVEFLRPTDKPISSFAYLPHSTVISSKKKNYVAFIKNSIFPEQPTEQRIISYLICNYQGEVQYTIPLTLHYDDPIPSIAVADDGRSILFEGSTGTVTVFTSKGELQRKIDLFENDVAALEKPIAGAVSTNAGKFVITAQKRPLTFEKKTNEYLSGEPWIFCFSFDGMELWKKPLGLITTSRVEISHNGKYVAVSYYSPSYQSDPTLRTTIFDEKGFGVMEVPHIFEKLEFSTNENDIVFINRDHLISINLTDKIYKKIKITSQEQGTIITSLKVNDISNRAIVLTAKPVFQNNRFEFVEPVLFQFDYQLEKKWEFSLPGDKFIEASIQLNGKEIGVGFLSGYKIYEEHVEK